MATFEEDEGFDIRMFVDQKMATSNLCQMLSKVTSSVGLLQPIFIINIFVDKWDQFYLYFNVF